MVQNISFRYNENTPWIYRDIEFGIDMDTRLALVGPNGAGKSTLLKLISGELSPSDGLIRRHSHLKIARYHQHLQDVIDVKLTPVQYMQKCYPEMKDMEQLRKMVGRYGITGKAQLAPIEKLSDGQKCRVVFAWLASQNPNLLLLDEPTNHLDIETIDSLAEAINEFNGGMMLVSHDFRLINQVAEEIWICENGKVEPWKGGIQAYKESLKRKVMKEEKSLLKGKTADHVEPTPSLGPKKRTTPSPKPSLVTVDFTPNRFAKANGNSVKENGATNGDHAEPEESDGFWDYND